MAGLRMEFVLANWCEWKWHVWLLGSTLYQLTHRSLCSFSLTQDQHCCRGRLLSQLGFQGEDIGKQYSQPVMVWQINYWYKVLIFWGCYCHITIYPEWFTVCDWEEGKEWKPEVKAIITWRVYSLSPCCCSVDQSCPTLSTPWIAACQISLSFSISQSLLTLLSVESVMPSIHLILCRPLLFLPAIFPSIRVFSNELALHIRWPKYWSFSFSISPSDENSGLISFRMDWLDLLAAQGNLKSLLQHHSSKASFLQCSAFFMVQLSHSYMTTGKT